MSPTAPLGQFLELAIPTQDIAASVLFYERLGFTQRLTGDAWPHPYGVLGDGRIHLGLHQRPVAARTREALPAAAALLEGPTPCFVYPDLAHQAERLSRAGLVPEHLQLGEESLHHLWLRDPGGHTLLLQEARTYSPARADAPAAAAEAAVATRSLCGDFLHLSLPEPNFEAALAFWERAGFVGMPAEAAPYAHQPLTSDQLDLAFHVARTCDAPLLVFEVADVVTTREQLRKLGIASLPRPPRALQGSAGIVLEAPEGTLLLLQQTLME